MAKRVALLTNFIPPYRLTLYKALADRLDDFQIFISTPMEPNRNWIPSWEGLNVTVQKNLTLRRSWNHPHGFSEDLYVHLPYDTLWLLRQYRPDAILSGEMGLRTMQALLYRRLNPTSRLILWATVSEYSEKGRGKLRERLRRSLVPQADAVLVNGQSGARYVSQFGVASEKIFFAPYTTNIAPFLEIPVTKEPQTAYRLLYVGQLVERKGLLQFLSALERWVRVHSERTLEFWLVGDGPLRTRLEEQVCPPNLELRFFGNVRYEKLPEFYKQAGIFVFPTLADEWGLVTNEAMAAGLPILGSLYAQSVEELTIDGETGWTFRPARPEEIDSALSRALSTPLEELETMRRRCRNGITFLTPDFVADQCLEAIRYSADPSTQMEEW